MFTVMHVRTSNQYPQTRYDMELQKDILGDRLQNEVVVLAER